MNLQPRCIEQLDKAVRGIGLVSHGEKVFQFPVVGSMDKSKAPTFWQHPGSGGIADYSVVQQIRCFDDKCPAGTQATGDLGKRSRGIVEMFYHHVAGDEVKAAVGKA